jgi:hypothetical protein
MYASKSKKLGAMFAGARYSTYLPVKYPTKNFPAVGLYSSHASHLNQKLYAFHITAL